MKKKNTNWGGGGGGSGPQLQVHADSLHAFPTLATFHTQFALESPEEEESHNLVSRRTHQGSWLDRSRHTGRTWGWGALCFRGNRLESIVVALEQTNVVDTYTLV